MLSDIFYILRTGIPWRDLRAAFGPWNSVYTRFRRWTASGRHYWGQVEKRIRWAMAIPAIRSQAVLL